MKVQTQIPIKAYAPAGFIGRYQKLVKDTVIPYQYSVLEDRAPDTEKSHVIANFINAGKALRGEDVGDGFARKKESKRRNKNQPCAVHGNKRSNDD